MATTTTSALVSAILVLAAVAWLWGQPFTSVVLGVVVAMISSLAVNEQDLKARAVSTALLIPGAAVSVALAVSFRGVVLLSDAVFVAVMVAAVYLRRWGPRGLAAGMIAFVSYFLALFLQATLGQLPVIITSAAVGALMSFLVHVALRPRHPGRDVRRVLMAWSVRAQAVLSTISTSVMLNGWDGRRRRRLRRRMRRCSAAATAAEQRVDGADTQVWDAIDNDTLTVRVFDVQLALERVAALVVPNSQEVPNDDSRTKLPGALDGLRDQLSTQRPSRTMSPDNGDLDPAVVASLDRCAQAWWRVWTPHPGDDPGEAEVGRDDQPGDQDDNRDAGDAGDRNAGDRNAGDRNDGQAWWGLSRTAVQVGVAAVLAIVVGQVVSPTRWFWAVIAAFVVFTGTSSREETLSKGWWRVVGTLGGVGAGVVVASLVGGDVVLALVMIAVCVFSGLYLMAVSQAWMIFFITTMLGLLYGLLGQFSAGLLLTRLEETVVGAVAGVLCAYLIFPARARHQAAGDIAGVLTHVEELLGSVADAMAAPEKQTMSMFARARALRETTDTLRATSKPLTGELAALSGTAMLRRHVMALGACEHHGRALARLAAAAVDSGVVDTPAEREAIGRAAASVAETAAALETAFDRTGSDTPPAVPSSDSGLEGLRAVSNSAAGPRQELVSGILRHLVAIDEALRGLADDLGAEAPPERSHAVPRGS